MIKGDITINKNTIIPAIILRSPWSPITEIPRLVITINVAKTTCINVQISVCSSIILPAGLEKLNVYRKMDIGNISVNKTKIRYLKAKMINGPRVMVNISRKNICPASKLTRVALSKSNIDCLVTSENI